MSQEKIWDYSTLSCFQTCRKKFYYQHILHLKPKLKGVPLLFGGAIHEGLDEWYTTNDVEKMVSAFLKNYEDREGDDLRTRANGEKMLRAYASKYATEYFKVLDKPEASFVYPIGNIMFGGRIDLPIEMNGDLWIMEHKTTTRLGGSYFNQYELDKQPTGYVLAAEEYFGRECKGCLMNVMEPWKDVKRVTAKTKAPEDHFLRKPISRNKKMKDRFKLNVQRIVRDIEWCKSENEYFEAEKKEVCTYYMRPCPFHALCQYGEDPRIIERDFIVEEWKPFQVEKELKNA